jgi:predicted transcriptional regulator
VRGFGELEAAVMELLWAADAPRTVREVHTELTAERPLAYTTVMTVMDKLHRKGWLTREPVGRAYAYTPSVSKDRYTADLMGEALAASSNRGAALLAFLDQLSPDEAAHLRAALDEQASNPAPSAARRRSTRRTG